MEIRGLLILKRAMQKVILVKFNWDNINEMEDFLITYMLYKEGKTASQISIIRGRDIQEVKMDIIRAKQHVKSMKPARRRFEGRGNLIEELLKTDRESRLSIISSLDENEELNLKRRIYASIDSEKNAEDLMVLLWMCGEFRDERLLAKVHEKSAHPHGGVRRMAYSAMGKISSERSLEFLHRGVFDEKPQARQYAINALSRIGSEKSLPVIERVHGRRGEKDYVRRAAANAIEAIRENNGEV